MRGLRAGLAALFVTAPLLAGTVPADPLRPPYLAFEAYGAAHSWYNTYLLALANTLSQRKGVKHLPGDDIGEKFQQVYGPLGLDVVAFVDTDGLWADTQALLLAHGSLLLVVVGGSEAHLPGPMFQDWILTDARISQVQLDGAGVHGGFHQAARDAHAHLAPLIRQQLSGERRLWLTGHSLGGAVASVLAYLLEADGVPVQGITTFASPRVGNSTWAANFEQRFGTRAQTWANERDPIVHIPPTIDTLEYVPAGTLNVIRDDRAIALDSVLPDDFAPSFGDHRIGAYLNYLYWSLPDPIRPVVPRPEPICAPGYALVDVHPEDLLGLCKPLAALRIDGFSCLEQGGDIVGDWCAFEEPGERRYRVRRLK